MSLLHALEKTTKTLVTHTLISSLKGLGQPDTYKSLHRLGQRKPLDTDTLVSSFHALGQLEKH